MTAQVDNPDRRAISEAIARVATHGPVALTSSAVLVEYGAHLMEAGPTGLTIRFVVPPGRVQGNGVVAGGVTSTVVDLAMALAVLAVVPPGSTCSSLSLTVNFLSALRGDVVTVDAHVGRVGRRTAFASAEARDPTTAAPIATATSALLVH